MLSCHLSLTFPVLLFNKKNYLDISGNLVGSWGKFVIFNFNFFLIKKELIRPFLFCVFYYEFLNLKNKFGHMLSNLFK